MLRLDDDVRFITTATISLKGLQASFSVECRLLASDVLRELQAKQDKGEITSDAFVKSWLTGWPAGQVLDAQGNPAEFSDAAVDRLLKQPGAPIALVRAFYAGYDEATEGNFEPLPAG